MPSREMKLLVRWADCCDADGVHCGPCCWQDRRWKYRPGYLDGCIRFGGNLTRENSENVRKKECLDAERLHEEVGLK